MLIGIGGGLGAVVRYTLGKSIGKWGDFPLATFLINVIGSFLLGFLSHELEGAWEQFLCIGFLGGFTTFSTFGYETNQLILNKLYSKAMIYVLFSVIISIIACYIGYQL